jgi:hypothetical protein
VVDEGSRHFLPPEPAGPEPELGGRPAPPPPPPPAAAPTPGHGGWQQPQPPGWGYAGPRPAQPDNGPAVAGFVLSIVSVALLVVSAGLSSVISVGSAIFGIVYSRKGKQKVQAGETSKNAGLAQAGFIVGIVSLCLAALATVVWALILVAAISDEQFRDDLEREFDNSQSIRAGLSVAAAAGRLLVA